MAIGPELEGDGIDLRVHEHAAYCAASGEPGRPAAAYFAPMDTKPIQINRRSKNITEGKSRAPNRSMYYAMGYQESDFKKPMVGVANGHSTITPCNSGLQKLADAAVRGHRGSRRQRRRSSARRPSPTAWPWAPRA